MSCCGDDNPQELREFTTGEQCPLCTELLHVIPDKDFGDDYVCRNPRCGLQNKEFSIGKIRRMYAQLEEICNT